MTVHRTLTVGMHGEDVRRFKSALKRRLEENGLWDQYNFEVDDHLTLKVIEAAWRGCYRLGSAWSTCAEIRHKHRIRESAQRIVRFPGNRAKWQLVKAAWRKRHAKKVGDTSGPSVMYDDVTLSFIPKTAKAVAGYTSGFAPTWFSLAKLFPHARHVSIAVNDSHDAKVLDVEKGDATPSQAPAWIKRQHSLGEKHPVIYCSVSDVATVVRACSAAGLKHGRDYLVWTAHYTFHKHLCSPACGFGMPFTADATQWTDKALGRSLDESICAKSFWK